MPWEITSNSRCGSTHRGRFDNLKLTCIVLRNHSLPSDQNVFDLSWRFKKNKPHFKTIPKDDCPLALLGFYKHSKPKKDFFKNAADLEGRSVL